MEPKEIEERHKDNLLVYGIYTSCIEAIKHYDTIQTNLRTLASTALLSSFAGVGFVFSIEKGVLGDIGPELISLLIVGFIILLIVGVGLLDLIFQERLLISNYIEALKLEKLHKWLPDIHQYMMYEEKHHSSPQRKFTFYGGCIITLGLIGLMMNLRMIVPTSGFIIVITCVSYIVIFLVGLYFFRRKIGKIEQFSKRLND